MKYVTQDDIKKINELYLQLKTYAAVSRATGFAPSTVKKYVIPNYQKVEEKNIIKVTGPLPNLESYRENFYKKDWRELCVLSAEEHEEIKGLWKELEL